VVGLVIPGLSAVSSRLYQFYSDGVLVIALPSSGLQKSNYLKEVRSNYQGFTPI
jgi:hypothetical protein